MSMAKGNFILNFDYKNNEVHYLPKKSSELEECQILFSFLKKKKERKEEIFDFRVLTEMVHIIWKDFFLTLL